jgi:hypothetical protein
MKNKIKMTPGMKARAKALARPLYTRPKDLTKYKEKTLLRAEHLQQQERLHVRNEMDRLASKINTETMPSLIKPLVRGQRSKLLS